MAWRAEKRRKRGPLRVRRLAPWQTFCLWVLGALAFVPIGTLALLRWVDPVQTSFMLNQRISEPDCARVSYEWVDRERLPRHVSWSALAAEDQRFLMHRGFDYESIQQAVQEHLEGGRRLRGASTISQQVVKNLLLWPGRSWTRKALEAYLTVWLELLWPKSRILEVYLNVAQFGPCTFGVEAASQRFFGKPAERLGPDESALLMSVLPNPTVRRADRPTPGLQRRADEIAGHARMLEGFWPQAL